MNVKVQVRKNFRAGIKAKVRVNLMVKVKIMERVKVEVQMNMKPKFRVIIPMRDKVLNKASVMVVQKFNLSSKSLVCSPSLITVLS